MTVSTGTSGSSTRIAISGLISVPVTTLTTPTRVMHPAYDSPYALARSPRSPVAYELCYLLTPSERC